MTCSTPKEAAERKQHRSPAPASRAEKPGPLTAIVTGGRLQGDGLPDRHPLRTSGTRRILEDQAVTVLLPDCRDPAGGLPVTASLGRADRTWRERPDPSQPPHIQGRERVRVRSHVLQVPASRRKSAHRSPLCTQSGFIETISEVSGDERGGITDRATMLGFTLCSSPAVC